MLESKRHLLFIPSAYPSLVQAEGEAGQILPCAPPFRQKLALMLCRETESVLRGQQGARAKDAGAGQI
ncbi:hypothetical protein B8V81_2909 [Paenibacillus pasadenensis]|uniref:Uncharacterized protein n=1 Tax=Paenibacillus pasadenensis TaxID=217090 RepID=A0A2N5N2B4_9BACL|nr:hypothetical protein B8V81_2909 [Paenibacillus pasadenensis]